MLRYSVIGTGAIGGFFGGRLARAGRTVRFLLHSDYEYVKQHGLRVDSCDGDFVLPQVEAFGRAEDMPESDVILVCLKSVKNHDLLPRLLRPLLHEQATVVLIQNGIGLEEDLQRIFPQLHIVAGLAFICCAKTGPGHICHQDYGSLNLGNFSCPDKRFQELLADLQDAGVALNTSTAQLLQTPATRALIYDQMMEVIGAARALGVDALTSEFADKMMAMTDKMTPYSPSMKLDFDNGRPMEIEYLYSRPIAEARKAGFEMPKLAMLEAELRFLSQRGN